MTTRSATDDVACPAVTVSWPDSPAPDGAVDGGAVIVSPDTLAIPAGVTVTVARWKERLPTASSVGTDGGRGPRQQGERLAAIYDGRRRGPRRSFGRVEAQALGDRALLAIRRRVGHAHPASTRLAHHHLRRAPESNSIAAHAPCARR